MTAQLKIVYGYEGRRGAQGMDAAPYTVSDLTMRAAYDLYHLPKLLEKHSARATLSNYRQALGVFETFCRHLAQELINPLMGRPCDAWAEPVLLRDRPRLGTFSTPAETGTSTSSTGSQPESGQAASDQLRLAQALVGMYWDRIVLVDDHTLKAFSRWMVASQYSVTTHNKHLKCIIAVLRSLGPREKGNPDGSGIITEVPHTRLLAVPQGKRRLVTPEQLDRLYGAAPAVGWPADTSVGAGLLWRCYLVLLYSHGYRVEDGRGLRWSNVHFEAASPDPNSITECSHGWIEFTSTKTGRQQILPMNAAVRSHVNAVHARCRHLPSDLVLDMRGRKQTRCSAFSRLCTAAGVDCDLSDLRKTSNTAHRKVCSTLRLSPLVPSLFLGHKARGVNEEFYTREDADMVRSVEGLGWQPVISDC